VPLGTIIGLLFWRAVSRGRSTRDFLSTSFSASDDELAEDGGLAPPSAFGCEVGSGIGEGIWFSCDAMMAERDPTSLVVPQMVEEAVGGIQPLVPQLGGIGTGLM
jgi:hypothetical protein